MKKFIGTAFAVCMLLFVAGCGAGTQGKGSAETTPEMDPEQKKLMDQVMKGGAPKGDDN